MADTIKGRRLNPQGHYEKLEPLTHPGLDVQLNLLDENVRKGLKASAFTLDR
jgi:hypothetical protein